jgi:hypothetical protein
MTITVAQAGRKGGKSRAKRLTPERRTEIARLAAITRWKKHRQKAAPAQV